MDLYIDQQRKYRYTAYIHYSHIIIIIIPMSNYYYLPSARNRFETYNSPIILWFRTFRHNGHHIIFFIKIPIFIVVQDGPPREEYNILYDTRGVHYNTPTSRTDVGFLHTHTHTRVMTVGFVAHLSACRNSPRRTQRLGLDRFGICALLWLTSDEPPIVSLIVVK